MAVGTHEEAIFEGKHRLLKQMSFIPFTLIVLLFQFACSSITIPELQEQGIRTFHSNNPRQQSGFNRISEVLIWNIKKGQEDTFFEDFKYLSDGKDLILLQEFLNNDKVLRAVLDQNPHEYILGVSFMYDGKFPQEATGVAIGSVVPPVDTIVFRPPGREPFLGTPKVTLCNTFKIQGSKKLLLVCNIHGYNFTHDEDFKKQIEMITPLLRTHQGPVLFGGDFNTNNKNKWNILEKLVIEDSGLTPVMFSPDDRKTANSWLFWQAELPIDHIFTRGLSVTNSRVWKELTGSDHDALSITITVEE